MLDVLDTLLVMVLCLIIEGFFSGSEIGVVSADRMKLRHDAAKGSRGAKLALRMLEKPEWLLSTTLVGTNIAVVTNTTMATALMLEFFGPEGSWLAVVLVAPLIWVFGEIVPKSVFQQKADALTPRVVYLLRACSYLFYPILIIFSALTRLLAKLVGERAEAQNPFTLREQIITMVRMSAENGHIQPHQQSMIRRLFDFGETSAREVMTPLIDVVSIEQSVDAGAAMAVAVSKSHKQLPVHAERVDRIIGAIDCLELLGVDPTQPITPYVKPVDYVPGSRSIQDLLLDLRRQGQEMAVVVDEYGGSEGIVTVEDIMEEVVEDIQDEYDAHETLTQWVRQVGERDYIASARIDLDSLQEELGIKLPNEKQASLAGFLLDKARDIPPVGAVIQCHGVSFTVYRGTPQVIQEVRVRW
jgi:putative hemolysin